MFSLLLLLLTAAPQPATIPPTRATALDGHTVTLPHDLSNHATILILGFSRNSEAATTAWGRPIQATLSSPPAIGVFNLAMLAEVPTLIRPMVTRSIRKQIPAILRGSFLQLTTDEPTWKQLASYDPTAPDAAYVLVVDQTGTIRYQTHAPYNEANLTQLTAAVHKLSTKP